MIEGKEKVYFSGRKKEDFSWPGAYTIP